MIVILTDQLAEEIIVAGPFFAGWKVLYKVLKWRHSLIARIGKEIAAYLFGVKIKNYLPIVLHDPEVVRSSFTDVFNPLSYCFFGTKNG